jgi:tetratricopeptide (TPR) repeat protein
MVALALLVLMAAPDSDSVKQMHRRCNFEKRLAKCPEAVDAYRQYLLQQPDDSEMRFYYAELLWSAERFAEAAVEYRRVAIDPKCRFARNAAYDYVYSRSQLVKPAPQPRFDGKPWPLTVEKQALVDAIDFYLELYPADRDSESVAYQAAKIYFEADDFVHAEQRLLWMVFHGYAKDYVMDLFKAIEERRNEQPDGVGESQAIGQSQTIGNPQDIGESQTIGEPQDIGGSDTVEYEPEEGEDVSDEYVVE